MLSSEASKPWTKFQCILLPKYDATLMRLLEPVNVGHPGRINRGYEHFLYDEFGRQENQEKLTVKQNINLRYGMLAAALLAVTPVARAQIQITGTPGSPDATLTIDGKQLPPPPAKFCRVIQESALHSKPYWPPRLVPPKGAPNILLIMTDDQGYGVSGTFGGVIPTPALDRVAKAGLRYTQYHSTSLCSPTRAALITG